MFLGNPKIFEGSTKAKAFGFPRNAHAKISFLMK